MRWTGPNRDRAELVRPGYPCLLLIHLLIHRVLSFSFRSCPQPDHVALHGPVLVSEGPRQSTVYLVSRSLFFLQFFVSLFLAPHHLRLVSLFLNIRLRYSPVLPVSSVSCCSRQPCIARAPTEHVQRSQDTANSTATYIALRKSEAYAANADTN
jgi:hypothetical protein